MTERMQNARDELAVVIGTRARAARSQLKLTQADVAERLGLSSEVYGRLERGLMRPSVETFRNLARVLELSADELLGLRERVGIVRRMPAGEERPEVRRLLRRVRTLAPTNLRLLAKLAGVIQRAARK